MVDAVQRIWRGFRNGSVQRPSYSDTNLPHPSVPGFSMSSMLVSQRPYDDVDLAEPEAAEVPDPDPVFVVAETVAEPERIESLQWRAEDARARELWDEAAGHYEALLLRQPEEAVHAVACAEAFRNGGDAAAADHVLERFQVENGPSIAVAINYALNAQAEQDWDKCWQRWHEARLAFPDLGTAWAAETAMLLILGRVDEAETVARDGVARLPRNIEILAQYAGICIARENWFDALDRLSEIECQAPLHPDVASHFATMRNLVTARIEAMPILQLMDRASRAEQGRDWTIAAHAWRVIYERDPQEVYAIIGYGQALRESGAFDEADSVLSAGIALIGDNQELFAHHAQVPAARQDWRTAASRWQRILQLFPDTPVVWSMAATAYREAGLLDPADMLLSRAIAREPARLDLRVQHALVAERQVNWPLAVSRWDIAYRLSADEPNIRNSRGNAIWEEAWERLERGDQAPAERSVEVSSADMKQVALQFEGLGDNCEFGIVQRHFGADPIGLFRFAAISAETLTDLLAEQLERLGDSKFTTLSLTAGNEYLVRDERGFYHMHSFVQKGTVDEATFLRQQVTRLTYLKRKLLEDLQDSRKIFVHKSSLARIDDETAIRLHDAIKATGPNILLVIRRAEADQPPGALTVLRRGLLVGYVSTLYSGEGSPIDFDSWRSVLLAAYGYRRGSNDQPADMPKP